MIAVVWPDPPNPTHDAFLIKLKMYPLSTQGSATSSLVTDPIKTKIVMSALQNILPLL